MIAFEAGETDRFVFFFGGGLDEVGDLISNLEDDTIDVHPSTVLASSNIASAGI
jgi:hypothetical protein